ncbi:MAG TPA: DUF3152 domain-containing protein, partial [Mycobacteriales bacterium]
MPNHSASSRHPARWAVGVAVLAVAALVLILRPAVGHSGDRAAPATVTTAPSPTPLPTTPSPTPLPTTPKPTPKPTPVTIPASGTGQLVTVPGTAGPTGPGTRMTYRLEIEGGLPLDGAAVAAQVQRTLTDPRGWQPIEHVAFVRTPGPASFELILASPTMVDRLCYPLDTVGELSCRNGNRVILNAKRWVDAVPWYRGHLDDYRAYLVNHEVGHRLGHGHKGCPAPGAPAPV